jgi:hypothetical protein
MSLVIKALTQILARSIGTHIGAHLVPIGTSLLVPVAAATALAMPPSLVEKIAAPVLGADNPTRDAARELSPATVDGPFAEQPGPRMPPSFLFPGLSGASPTGLLPSAAPATTAGEQQSGHLLPPLLSEDGPVARQTLSPGGEPTVSGALDVEAGNEPPAEPSPGPEGDNLSRAGEPANHAVPPPPAEAPATSEPEETDGNPTPPVGEAEGSVQEDQENTNAADEPAGAPTLASGTGDGAPATSTTEPAPAPADAPGSTSDGPSDEPANEQETSSADETPLDPGGSFSIPEGQDEVEAAADEAGAADSPEQGDVEIGEPSEAGGSGDVAGVDGADSAEPAESESGAGETDDNFGEEAVAPVEETAGDTDEPTDQGDDAQDPNDASDPRNDRCLRPREAISTSHRPWWTLGRCSQNAHGHWLWIWIVDWLEQRGWGDEEL